MQAAPRDKMIRSRDEIRKEVSQPVRKDAPKKRLRRFFFPHLSTSVVAETQEEAEKLVSRPTN
jgi:hypothetical protein